MTFLSNQQCRVPGVLWVCVGVGLALFGFQNRSLAAPPDFAGAGMAPNDVDVMVSMSHSEGSKTWVTYFEDVASDALGKNAVAQWQAITSFLRSIVGEHINGDGPKSHLFIRFGDRDLGADWVFAVELIDRDQCVQGFRTSGATLNSGGGFLLSQGNIEVYVSGEWLVAGPVGSVLRDDVSTLAAINVRDTDDPELLEVITPLPRSSIELVIRHASPMGGCTALAISEMLPGIARVHVHGTYDASPFPSRTPGNLDVRLINEHEDHSSITMYESGIGILDPMLVDLGLSIPELLPPAVVRRGLGLQRVLVMESMEHTDGFRPPAMSLAVPFRVTEEAQVEELKTAIDAWMKTITGLSGLHGSDSESDLQDHVRARVGVLSAIRNHPLAKGATLNWTISEAEMSTSWFVAGTTSHSVDRLRSRLEAMPKDRLDDDLSTSQGMVHANELAGVIQAFADMRGEGVDQDAPVDSRLLNVLVDIASRFKDVKWNFQQQDQKAISGSLELSIPKSSASSEEPSRP